jgi:uncharacterized protein DUF4410
MTEIALDDRNGRSCPVRSENRHRGRLTLAALLVGLLAALSGCGAVQTKAHDVVGASGLQPNQDDKDAGLVGIGPGFQIKDYRVIAVDRFAVAPEDIQDEDDKALAASMPLFLQSELVRRLRDSGLFAKVVNLTEAQFPTGPERALKLEGTITRLTGGSRALRFWIGFGAGRSKAQVETRFVDRQSGRIVLVTADRRVAAVSEALSLDYGGDSVGLLKQSFDNMARDLARFLTRLQRGEAPKAD